MGDYNLTGYQNLVIGMIDELESDNPRVVAGDHTDCINWAANNLIRMFPDRFPEHQDNTWVSGPTTVSYNYLAIADNILAIDCVNQTEGATVSAVTPGLSLAGIAEEPVAKTNAGIIALLNKSTTTTGYPKLWARQGTNLLYHPTTQTGYTTTFIIHGLAGEVPLSSGGATFRLHRDYDEIVALLAAAKMARICGFTDRSMELNDAAKRTLGEMFSVPNYEAPMMVIGSEFEFDAWRTY